MWVRDSRLRGCGRRRRVPGVAPSICAKGYSIFSTGLYP